jgi:glycosyltransferase involved in cell wall biosynthesis
MLTRFCPPWGKDRVQHGKCGLERTPVDGKTGGVVLLTALPAPYYISAWNHLARLTGGEFAACFLSATSPRRPWTLPVEEMNFEWQALGQVDNADGVGQVRAGAGMLRFLSRRQPCAVVCGSYDTVAAWLTLAWCKLFRRHFVLWTESNSRDHRPRSPVRTLLKRIFVAKSDAIAVLGKAAWEYAKQLGGHEDRIFWVPFGGDNRFFAREAEKVDGAWEKKLMGWPPRLILYCGRLVPEKGVFILLEAFRQISQHHPDVGLLFVGHGSAQQEMKDYCGRLALDRTYFVGPQDYKRMPYFYALSDILVLPTFSDPYGYVVIEAFACGVPAIVSRVAGVCDDCIVEGETGFAVEPGNPQELAQKIEQLLSDEALRVRVSANCRRLAEKYSPEACAEGLSAAVSRALATASPRHGTPSRERL